MNAQEIAKLLIDARKNRQAIDPIRDYIGIGDEEKAYEIQHILTQHKLDSGARIVGKKIGLTTEVVQKQLGISSPDYGVLFDDMEVLNGLSISMSKLMQPKVEAEIAFVLGEDLEDPSLTSIDLMNAIDYALPAIEIVGSRIKNWNIKATDTIADNASSSHFVVGHSPRTLDEIDMVACKMSLTVNGTEQSSGYGGACLGSPLNATLWLAKKLLSRGEVLQAGEVIFSGSLGKFADVTAGDHVEAYIEGFAKVSVHFKE